jgi:hypothetical protein
MGLVLLRDSAMKLRQGKQSDILNMVIMGRIAHAESRFSQFPYDEEKMTKKLEALINWQDSRGSHLCLLAENSDGRVIGCLLGAMEEYFFTRTYSASSLLLWVNPEYRGSAAALRLVQAFRKWGAKQGAMEVCIPIASGVNIARTDRFLRRLGFSQTGGNYSALVAEGQTEMTG